MIGYAKILVVVVVVAVAVAVGVSAYFLMLPRVSLLVYPDSKVTGTKERLSERVVLHVKNEGTVNLNINACTLGQTDFNEVTYTFQDDLVVPVGVEAVIVFPAAGGEIKIETISGPSVASGGVYAISDNPDPNPFGMGRKVSLLIYTKSGRIGGGVGTSIAVEE